MAWAALGVGAVTAVGGMISSNKNRAAANRQASDARIERQKQQAELNKQKAEYKSMEFKNVYADMENVYENQENVYEDLTVNQQQAQFQAQQGSQQRANIMQNLQGAAGSSGIAGLAQAMANQGQLQTQQISASIGQQEAANQRLRAGEASRIQTSERLGAANVQTAKLGGEQWVQEQEIGRQGTLLGMQMGAASGANVAHQQAQANQMNAQIAQQQSMMDFGGVLAQGAGEAAKALGEDETPPKGSG